MNNNAGKKELPSSKLSLSKQIEVLKTFTIIYKEKNSGLSYKDIASQIGANANNVSDSIKFWKENGLLEFSQRGIYIPSKGLTEFNQKAQWDEDNAWTILRKSLEDAWFIKELQIKFQLKKSLTNAELVQMLGMLSGSSKKDSKTTVSINTLIEFLELIQFIKKDEQGNYSLNEEMSKNAPNEIIIEDSKDMVQVSIGGELYAVDSDEIQEFVKTKGKKLDKSIQKLD